MGQVNALPVRVAEAEAGKEARLKEAGIAEEVRRVNSGWRARATKRGTRDRAAGSRASGGWPRGIAGPTTVAVGGLYLCTKEGIR